MTFSIHENNNFTDRGVLSYPSDWTGCFKNTGGYCQVITPRLDYFSLKINVLSLTGKIVIPQMASNYSNPEIIFSSEFSIVIVLRLSLNNLSCGCDESWYLYRTEGRFFLKEKKERERGVSVWIWKDSDLITCMSRYFFSTWVHLGRGGSWPRQGLRSEASWSRPLWTGLTSLWLEGQRMLAAP